MSRTAVIGLCLVMSLSVVAPAWSQGGENNAIQAIKDEQNAQKRIQLIEEFIDRYRNSAYRPDLDMQLYNLYLQNRDWAKMMRRAEDFRLEVPTAEAKAKVYIYTRAMVAAQQVKNPAKVTEFAEYVLAADPNDLNALLTLTSDVMARLPQDAAAREAAFTKALGYAKRIQSVPKAATISDEDWQRSQARAHVTIGFIQFTKNQWADAATEYSAALKTNPKDADGQFRLGVSYFNLIIAAVPAVQAAIKAVDDAAAAKADQKQLDELVAKREAASKEMLDRRDLAIDSLARALALGLEAARPTLETLYKNKTGGSVEGLDQLIGQKKAELGL